MVIVIQACYEFQVWHWHLTTSHSEIQNPTLTIFYHSLYYCTFMICSFIVKPVRSDLHGGRRLKNLDAKNPLNPNIFFRTIRCGQRYIQLKSWFRYCFIIHGNMYDEHLDNAGKLYYCHPSVPEHAILPS